VSFQNSEFEKCDLEGQSPVVRIRKHQLSFSATDLAATKLREGVLSGSPETQVILETYSKDAKHIEPSAEEFIRDLEDIIAITRWAEEEGASRMTLDVNW